MGDEKLGIFKDPGWEYIMDGNFIYFKGGLPPIIYVVKKNPGDKDQVYVFAKDKLNRVYTAKYKDDGLLNIDEFSNDYIEGYMAAMIRYFTHKFESDSHLLNIVNNIDTNNPEIFKYINSNILKIKKLLK